MTSRLARIASWVGSPLGMSLAYTVLAITSETDTSGKAWMAMGFGFVLVLWMVFRLLVEHAGLARAIAVGDADKILSITDTQLPRKRGAARARLLVHRAVAHELRTDWAAAVAALDEAGGARPGRRGR